MRHLGESLDKIRKTEYYRLCGNDRSYIKGLKYTLLSNRENLTLDGLKSLKKLLKANKRIYLKKVLVNYGVIRQKDGQDVFSIIGRMR